MYTAALVVVGGFGMGGTATDTTSTATRGVSTVVATGSGSLDRAATAVAKASMRCGRSLQSRRPQA